MKDSLLFGIIQQVKEYYVIVRLKTEGDTFYKATGVLCRVSRFDLVSTDLIAAHTGKTVYYGGPHSYCNHPVYTWWSEPEKCGKFTTGDIIHQADGHYKCNFIIICFFKSHGVIKVLVGELSESPTTENAFAALFHTSVQRFLKDNWDHIELNLDTNKIIKATMNKFLTYYERGAIDIAAEFTNKQVWDVGRQMSIRKEVMKRKRDACVLAKAQSELPSSTKAERKAKQAKIALSVDIEPVEKKTDTKKRKSTQDKGPKEKKKRLQPSPVSPTDLPHEETYEEYASPPPKLPHPRPTSQITSPSPYQCMLL